MSLLQDAKIARSYLNVISDKDFAKEFVLFRGNFFKKYHNGLIISNSHGINYFDNVVKYWDNPISYIEKLTQKDELLIQQSKMAQMGEMLENIAHQWRQPLSVISTISSSLKIKKEMNILDDKEFYEALNNINKTSEYLSNTIDDFRNFFSPNKEMNKFSSKNLLLFICSKLLPKYLIHKLQ